MADKKAGKSNPSKFESSSSTEGEGLNVKRLHYIYHVVAETSQLIKIEELDEDTQTTREIPLPLYVNWGQPDREAYSSEDVPEESDYADASEADEYSYGRPQTASGMWWIPINTFQPVHVASPRRAARRRPDSRFRADAESFRGTDPSSGLGISIDPPKAGLGVSIDPPKAGLGVSIDPPKAGPLRFVAPTGPPRTGGPSPGGEGPPDEDPDTGSTFSPTGIVNKP